MKILFTIILISKTFVNHSYLLSYIPTVSDQTHWHFFFIFCNFNSFQYIFLIPSVWLDLKMYYFLIPYLADIPKLLFLEPSHTTLLTTTTFTLHRPRSPASLTIPYLYLKKIKEFRWLVKGCGEVRDIFPFTLFIEKNYFSTGTWKLATC